MFTHTSLRKIFLSVKTSAIFLLTAVFLFASPLSALAATKTVAKPAPFTYTRLFYYREGTASRQSFFAHASSIDVFAPQTYELDETGALIGTVAPDLLAFAQQNKIKVMPLVTNGDFTQASYQAILNDPIVQTAALNALVAEAQKNGYWGWQVDFEQMDASYKDSFSAFIQHAYSVMQANHLAFSVAVIAKVSDTPSDYPKNLWQKLIGVYDFTALANSTDFVSVMSYDDPNSKGPVAEYPWLQKVLAYSLAHIPKQKISLGLAFYYWQWNDTTGKLIGIGGNNGLQNAIQKHKVTVHYSATQQAPYLSYKTGGQNYVIWYENERSIAQKISLIKKYGLAGFSGWALGFELPTVYAAMKE